MVHLKLLKGFPLYQWFTISWTIWAADQQFDTLHCTILWLSTSRWIPLRWANSYIALALSWSSVQFHILHCIFWDEDLSWKEPKLTPSYVIWSTPLELYFCLHFWLTLIFELWLIDSRVLGGNACLIFRQERPSRHIHCSNIAWETYVCWSLQERSPSDRIRFSWTLLSSQTFSLAS